MLLLLEVLGLTGAPTLTALLLLADALALPEAPEAPEPPLLLEVLLLRAL